MDLLEELKREVASLDKAALAAQKQPGNHEEHKKIARAKLNEALKYYTELFNLLKVTKPVIARCYYFNGDGRFENLLQSEYDVKSGRRSADQTNQLKTIVLQFSCSSEQNYVVERQSQPMVESFRNYLWENNLKFDVKEIRNERGYVERGIFAVRHHVPVAITIVSDLEHKQIKITAKNLEKFGECMYVYDFDEFGKDILEELAKVILAKPNNLRALGREQALRSTNNVLRLARHTSNASF